MDQIVQDYLASITLGEAQHYKNITVFPLFSDTNHGPEYLTLKEAMESGTFLVTEVSEGGTVPELKVINKGEKAVLLLDGEELSGSKQNRVLNATILIAAHAEVIIPVSCTEHGRWSYTSSHFADSDTMMAYRVKRENVRNVAVNLKVDMRYQGDQGVVWDGIAEMAREANVHSQTGAMKDVFEARKNDLDAFLKTIPPYPHQKGILVFINGKVAGMDIVSSESACAIIHPKLLKSYAMDALLDKKKIKKPGAEDALKFLQGLAECQEQKYKSVGLGWDHRFEAPQKVGSALVLEDSVIHMAFFAIEEGEKVGNMSSFIRRRGYRVN
jgi:hypothetical protein